MHQNPSPTIIDIKGLNFSYNDKIVFSDFSYSIVKGSLNFVTGRNGSGKTTLLKIISTLLRFSKGKVRVADLDLLNQDEAVREKISCQLLNSRGLFTHLSVEENLLLHGRLYGLSDEHIHLRIEELQDLLEAKHHLMPSELSSGMRQTVQIAKALLRPTEIYLFDEPFVSLDQEHTKRVQQHLESLIAKSKTVVLTMQQSDLQNTKMTGRTLCLE